MLEIVDARPPNFEQIAAVLPGAAAPGVIFAYGGRVYAPGVRKLSVELQAHEQVHLDRQGADPDAWWAQYLRNPLFRYEEELLAHRAEYRTYHKRHLDPIKRARALGEISRKLSSALYGKIVTPGQAESAILGL